MFLGQTTRFVHSQVNHVLSSGEIAVDATVGNGHDTLFLAQTVGSRGGVHGFDIQQQALNAAEDRLARAGVVAPVSLHLAGHESMAEVLSGLQGRVGAVMFNFGYLPGADTGIITKPETSCRAIDGALDILRPNGLITMILYSGHPGGAEEAGAILSHCKHLPSHDVQVMHCSMWNHLAPKVSVVLMEKKCSAKRVDRAHGR